LGFATPRSYSKRYSLVVSEHLLALSKFIRRFAAIRVQPVRNGAQSSKILERTFMTMFARLLKQREWMHLFWTKKANLRSHGLNNKEKVGMAIRQWFVIQKFYNWSQNWHTIRIYFYQDDERIPSCILQSKFCKQSTNKPKK